MVNKKENENNKALLSLDNFVKMMTHIEKQLEKDDKLTDLLMCEDCTGWVTTCSDVIHDLINTMSLLLDDECEWISWWLWELDDDKSHAHVIIEDNDTDIKTEYTIKTTTDLYYLIIGQLDKISIKREVTDEEVQARIDECDSSNVTEVNGDGLYDLFTNMLSKYTESDN